MRGRAAELVAAGGPQVDRLSGVVTGAVAALQVRTGGVPWLHHDPHDTGPPGQTAA